MWLQDNLQGTAGATLTGHTPQTGLAWTTPGGNTSLTFTAGGVIGNTSQANLTASVPQSLTAPTEITVTYTAGANPGSISNVIGVLTDFDSVAGHYVGAFIADSSSVTLGSGNPNVQAQVNGASFVNNISPWYTGTFDTGQHTFTVRREPTFTNGVVLTAFIDGNPLAKQYTSAPPTAEGHVYLSAESNWIVNSITANQPTQRAPVAFACQGDSLTWGGQLSSTFGLTTGQSYPAVLQSLLGPTSQVEVSNLGYPGATTSQLAPATAANILNDPLLTLGAVGIYLAGINDLIAGTSLSTIETNIAAWVTAVRAVGAIAIVGTICHVGPNATANYVSVNANADTLNAYIRSHYTGAPTLTLDFEANTLLNDYTNTTYRYTDQIHYTPAGYALMAQLAYAQAGGYGLEMTTAERVTSADATTTDNPETGGDRDGPPELSALEGLLPVDNGIGSNRAKSSRNRRKATPKPPPEERDSDSRQEGQGD